MRYQEAMSGMARDEQRTMEGLDTVIVDSLERAVTPSRDGAAALVLFAGRRGQRP